MTQQPISLQQTKNMATGAVFYTITQDAERIHATAEDLHHLVQDIIHATENEADAPSRRQSSLLWLHHRIMHLSAHERYEEAAVMRDIRRAVLRDARQKAATKARAPQR